MNARVSWFVSDQQTTSILANLGICLHAERSARKLAPRRVQAINRTNISVIDRILERTNLSQKMRNDFRTEVEHRFTEAGKERKNSRFENVNRRIGFATRRIRNFFVKPNDHARFILLNNATKLRGRAMKCHHCNFSAW